MFFSYLKKAWSSWRKSLSNKIFCWLHSFVVPLRYKIEIKGSEYLDLKKGGVNSSILFLSNHTSHIDATVISVEILKRKLPLTIWALDETFKLPYLRWAARHKETVKVVKVPNITERRSEKHQSHLHKLITRTADGLRKGENFLIFPSGCLKKTPVEKMEGKSAIPLLLSLCPDVNIILIRISGLWGSRFSRATKPEERWASRWSRGWDMLWQSLKIALLNGIFFIPKRKVTIELLPAGEDFPRFGSRLEINRYLEKYFNEPWGVQGEPLYRVPDYFWRESYIEHEFIIQHYHYNLNKVPKPLRNAVVSLIADKADLDCKEVDFDMHLGRDLGLDSLDLAEILTQIENQYGIKRLVPEDLTTVGHLIAIAAKIPIIHEVTSNHFPKISDHKPHLKAPRRWVRLPNFQKSLR